MRAAGVARDRLPARTRARLLTAGVQLGAVSVFLPKLLQRGALERRATLLRAFEPELRLPALGRSQYEARAISASTWRCLGYVTAGPRACRVDLAERALDALRAGASEMAALQGLAVPRRDVPSVARALEHTALPRREKPVLDGAQSTSE